MNETFEHPDAAIAAIADRVLPVGVELGCEDLVGRVLAESIHADRDSPAADVSAMDGYAIFPGQLSQSGELNVVAECVPGSPPPELSPSKSSGSGVVRIFTGAVVPRGCDRVIQREHTIESQATIDDDAASLGTIRWKPQANESQPGLNIRRRGENLRGGDLALPAGTLVKSPQMASLANFGIRSASVYSLVRVAIITTGDEMASEGDGGPPISPWQIRNSNSLTLAALIDACSYTVIPTLAHSPDEPEALRGVIEQAIASHDAVLLTGGVSMGDHDYVPSVLKNMGAETIFHRLPLRPGRPILGVVYQETSQAPVKPILGLPGNPVSATMGAVRFALPLIAKLAGVSDWNPHPPLVRLEDAGSKTLPLHWMRAVRMIGPGLAELVIGQGSGDLVSMAQSDGFIEMPANANDEGPWPYFAWS
ncbi:molybdopterin molybdotransferase MoeA [Neorhodopirellula pilleata]|uniref:Molybdopterin molybdenumtransferase n=1 Tax=Neorhodopirellula pilleata TaxID=2714738 RepID=A0A5C6ARZ7_9BACT|nr:molybdopterin molybdotransferase MoeA [Neorhodopirellula pilleata]TWU02029.1 Molybdopterin molybdenumtransferase [Neorhodopirellula pilleata]